MVSINELVMIEALDELEEVERAASHPSRSFRPPRIFRPRFDAFDTNESIFKKSTKGLKNRQAAEEPQSGQSTTEAGSTDNDGGHPGPPSTEGGNSGLDVPFSGAASVSAPPPPVVKKVKKPSEPRPPKWLHEPERKSKRVSVPPTRLKIEKGAKRKFTTPSLVGNKPSKDAFVDTDPDEEPSEPFLEFVGKLYDRYSAVPGRQQRQFRQAAIMLLNSLLDEQEAEDGK